MRRTASPCLALVLLALVSLPRGAAAQSAPALRVDARSRSVAPGELVILTMTGDSAAIDNVRVTAFSREIRAYRSADGTWQALVGIDLDQRPGRYTANIEADAGGATIRESHTCIVERRTFPTRTLRVNPDFVNPPPEELTRIAEDQKFIRMVYASSAATRLWSEPFTRPVPGTANSAFGSRSVFNGQPRSPHAGADFLSPSGTPIVTPNAGRVLCARSLYFTGNTVIIDHGLGVFSKLAHLSRLDVHEGDAVQEGQIVGLVGATGRVTGPHLHWALSVSGARVDPLSMLAVLGDTKARAAAMPPR